MPVRFTMVKAEILTNFELMVSILLWRISMEEVFDIIVASHQHIWIIHISMQSYAIVNFSSQLLHHSLIWEACFLSLQVSEW